MHVIVSATPITGHVRPMLQVAQYLLARRQEVAPGFDQVNLDFIELYARPVAAQHEMLQELLTPDSVLICDNGYTGAWPVLLGADGVRPALAIGVGVTAMALTSDDTTPLAGPVPGDPELARAAHRAANDELVAAVAPSHQRIERAVRETGARRSVPFFFDACYSVWDVAAQLCVPEFEYSRSDAPSALRFVGPLPVPTFDEVPLPDWWPRVTAGERPVVLVSQGTLANADTDELIAPTIEALADTDVLVVVALGREPSALNGDRRPLPGNVRLGGFLPFHRLLPSVSVAVTNGGYGSTQQMLRHGIPMVVAGAEDDKAFVAARIAACGAGIDLGTGRPDREQIRAAVETIRSMPHHRRAARAMAELIGRTDALSTIEEMVRAAAVG